MTRLFFSILILILFCSGNGQADVRDYSKLADSWKSDSNKAYASGKTLFEDNTIIINLLVISFEKKYECSPVLKVAFLDDPEYGELLKTIPMDSGFLKIYVDNNIIYDGNIVRIEYQNATEFGVVISPEMLNFIYGGNIIQVELVNIMDIIFNLKNSKYYIEKAKEYCLQD